MNAEEDFDPLALPDPPPLAPIIPISPKKQPAPKKRPVPQAEEPLPVEPPEFDPAPVHTPAPAPKASVSRTAPHSIEAEEYLLSCCLMDGPDVIPKCAEAQIAPASFYDGRHGTVFACILDLHRRGLPTEIVNVAEELKRTQQLDRIGGFPFLVQVSQRIPTTAQAGYFIKTVRGYAMRREMIRVSTAVIEDAYSTSDALDIAEKCERTLTEVLRRSQNSSELKPMPHAALAYPTSSDPNVLLGYDDYLGRGGGMLFISHGGAGKSSFIYDAACSWSLGKAFMGIRCNGKLRTLMIQAEDSERYMGKLRTSFDHIEKLTEAQARHRDENVIIYHARGITGQAFFSLLRRLVDKHAPDLVVINPIYLYAEGDISSSESAQPFLLGLDAINRDQRFAYILVHHTGKPAKKEKSQRAELDDWETTYMGFGSSFFANWPRCTMLLEPRKERGEFWLRLGKAGTNAGVTKLVDHGGLKRHEPTTKIGLRHSREVMEIGGVKRPAIYWEHDQDAKDEPAKKSSRDAEKKQDIAEALAVFPDSIENAISLAEAARIAHERYGIGSSAFSSMRQSLTATGALKMTEAGKYYRASTST